MDQEPDEELVVENDGDWILYVRPSVEVIHGIDIVWRSKEDTKGDFLTVCEYEKLVNVIKECEKRMKDREEGVEFVNIEMREE